MQLLGICLSPSNLLFSSFSFFFRLFFIIIFAWLYCLFSRTSPRSLGLTATEQRKQNTHREKQSGTNLHVSFARQLSQILRFAPKSVVWSLSGYHGLHLSSILCQCLCLHAFLYAGVFLYQGTYLSNLNIRSVFLDGDGNGTDMRHVHRLFYCSTHLRNVSPLSSSFCFFFFFLYFTDASTCFLTFLRVFA